VSWRSEPPFRADHVGSLLRPARLLEARQLHAAGELDDDGLRAAEDDAIRDAVRMQQDVGLQSATDGEFRRASWHMDFIFQLGGASRVLDDSLKVEFRNDAGTIVFAPPSLHIDAPVRLEHTIFADAFRFLRDTVTDAVP
jgi:5-methyltetrahydropteroyltriglutamate--homocysteine methyltransferase